LDSHSLLIQWWPKRQQLSPRRCYTLAMALLTPMTLEEAKAIAQRFGLRVVGLSPIPQGSVNSNFALALENGGRAFMRVCEESDHDAVRAQNRLLTHLVSAGVSTPSPMSRTDGSGTIDDHRGKPIAVFAFREGSWICQQRVEQAHLERVGEVLATIHAAGAGYQGAPENRFGTAQLRARIVELQRGDHGTMSSEISADVVSLATRLDEVTAKIEAHADTTIVHGDVFRDNVLWKDDGTLSAVLDFESAAPGHPAFDLMVAMLAWCYSDRFEQPLVHALMRGYRSRRVLSDQELDACYDQARAAAVRFAITRITDYELRPRGIVVYKDYRRFTARLAAIEEIGRDDYVAWLG
jgi:homoserine kinase type II